MYRLVSIHSWHVCVDIPSFVGPAATATVVGDATSFRELRSGLARARPLVGKCVSCVPRALFRGGVVVDCRPTQFGFIVVVASLVE